MSDNVTINIQQDNDIVNIVSSQVTEVIDINVAETTEEVTLNITEEIIQVNINKVTGGGGNQNLQDVTDLGNHTTNDIYVENNEYYSIVEPYDVGTSNINSGAYTYISGDGAVGIRTNNSEGTIKTTNLAEVLTLEFPDKTGIKTIATTEDIPNITTLVPYTGANDNVNIGNNDLYTKKVFLLDEVNENYGSIHYADGDLHIEDADGHKLLVIEDGFMQLHLSDTIQSNLYTSNLTAVRNHYLPDNSGTIALTSDITGTNSGTNTGDETATSIKTKLGITTLSGSNTGDQDLSGYVPTIRTINSKSLSSNVTLTTADIADSTNKRYVTDANLTTIGNQSGTNTGDETTATIKSKLGAATTSTDGYLTSANWNTFNSKLVGVHTLKALSSGQSTNLSINTTAFTTVVGISNRMYLMPYIPNVSFTSASLYINVSTLLLTANARILIYSDVNGVPTTKLYESSNLDCSTIGIKTATTAFSFVAGTTYWLCVHSSLTPSYTAYNVSQLMPILSSGTSIYFGYVTTQTFGSAPTTLTSPTITNTTPPFVGITF